MQVDDLEDISQLKQCELRPTTIWTYWYYIAMHVPVHCLVSVRLVPCQMWLPPTSC